MKERHPSDKRRILLVPELKGSMQEAQFPIDSTRLDLFQTLLNVLLYLRAGQLGCLDVYQGGVDDRFYLQSGNVVIESASA